MSKKRNKKRKDRERGGKEGAGESSDEAAISSRGKKTIAAGIGILILGFGTLTLTDPEGRNWASTASPLLILGAYAIIAFGIFLPETDHLTEEIGIESGEPQTASGQQQPGSAPDAPSSVESGGQTPETTKEDPPQTPETA